MAVQPADRAERRLAAIFAADVMGYSRLMGADEEGTLERLKSHRSQLVDPKVREHRGRIVKTTGDGMLAEFASVVDAVRCAVEVQRGMVDRNSDTPEDQRILWRIGINLGDVIIDGDDIHGDGVNVAARLEALAEPGGICIERTVRNQVRDKLPYSFEDMGEQSVKNIARPVRAYAMGAGALAATPLVEVRASVQASPVLTGRTASPRLAIIGASLVVAIGIGLGSWWVWRHPGPPPPSAQDAAKPLNSPAVASAAAPAPRLSIVVLPFANLSNDPQQDYFVDAITDDLTTDLSRISGSFVISRNTAFAFKGKPVDAKQIGRDLGVRYILEGSVQRSGDRVQVNAQLIDGDTGAHVWADRFETDSTRLGEAQNDIVARLARALDLALVAAVSHQIEREATINPNAQDLVMRGRAAFYRPNWLANRQEAQRLFEEALEVDPHSVDARIGIARVLIRNIATFIPTAPEEDEARAERLLLEALDDDPSSGLAHALLGQLRRFQNRLTESRVELETAIALDPNNLVGINQLGWTWQFLGEPRRSISFAEQSLRLSPRDGVWGPYQLLGHSYLLLNELDPAIDNLIKSRAANRDAWPTHFLLAAALALKGHKEEAQEALAGGLKLKPDYNSVAIWRIGVAWTHDPKFVALSEATLIPGLLRAGLPEK